MGVMQAVAAGGAVGSVAYNAGSVVMQGAYSNIRRALFGEAVKAVRNTLQTKEGTKSAENQQTPVASQPYGNLASVSPCVELPTLTEMPLYKIPPSLYADREFHCLSDIVQNATLYTGIEVTTTTTTLIPVTPLEWSGWVGNVMEYFRFYRARPRLILSFFTSPLIASRFSVNFTPTLPGTGLDAGYPLESFEVKGSVTKVFEIPWVALSPVLPVAETLGTVTLSCDAAPRPLTSGGVAKVFVLVHVALGPGAQFFSIRCPPKAAWVDPTPIPAASEPVAGQTQEITGHSSLREIARVEPDISFCRTPVIKAVSYMDETTTIEELMGRWNSSLLVRSSSFVPMRNDIQAAGYDSGAFPGFFNSWGDNVDAWAPCFTLWRGSREYRFATSTGAGFVAAMMSQDESSSYGNGLDFGNGTYAQPTGSEVVSQLRVPFLSRYLAVLAYTGVRNANSAPFAANSTLAYTDLIVYTSRSGPDFQVFHLNRLFPGAATYFGTAEPPPVPP